MLVQTVPDKIPMKRKKHLIFLLRHIEFALASPEIKVMGIAFAFGNTPNDRIGESCELRLVGFEQEIWSHRLG
jgi:hypothetical protein